MLTASQPFTSALVMSNPKLFKYSYVWIKTNSTNFLNAKKQPLRKKEDVLVFYKKQPVYYPQGLIKQTVNNNRPFKTKKGEHINGKEREIGLSEFINYPTDIIEIPNLNYRSLHPTQKPVALFEYLIKTYTSQGMTVLDNTAGSMTTAIAAINTNRNWICMEKDAAIYNTGINRIAEHLKSIDNKNKQLSIAV